MYPVLILTHVPDFLDTSGMGVTIGIRAGRSVRPSRRVVLCRVTVEYSRCVF